MARPVTYGWYERSCNGCYLRPVDSHLWLICIHSVFTPPPSSRLFILPWTALARPARGSRHHRRSGAPPAPAARGVGRLRLRLPAPSGQQPPAGPLLPVSKALDGRVRASRPAHPRQASNRLPPPTGTLRPDPCCRNLHPPPHCCARAGDRRRPFATCPCSMQTAPIRLLIGPAHSCEGASMPVGSRAHHAGPAP